MRAAVIGTGWGRVHVAALRKAGVDVVAICARNPAGTREAADAEGIPLAFTDPTRLHTLDLDLVTIATPPATHPPLLATFPDLPVLCEKPVVGLTGDIAAVPAHPRVRVNYAFAFLDTARAAAATLATLGRVRRARVHSRVDLPDAVTDPAAALLEVASHPWSWLLHLLGPDAAPHDTVVDVAAHQATLRAPGTIPTAPAVEVAVTLDPGFSGLQHSIELDTDHASLQLTGEFHLGHDWRYGPVLLDGHPVSDTESGPPDPWYRANARAVATFVDLVAGRLTPQDATRAGLPDLPTAHHLDRCVRDALGIPAAPASPTTPDG